jgi:hypothetical protein
VRGRVLCTRDLRRAAALVHKGLINNKQIIELAA